MPFLNNWQLLMIVTFELGLSQGDTRYFRWTIFLGFRLSPVVMMMMVLLLRFNVEANLMSVLEFAVRAEDRRREGGKVDTITVD